jgi:hypothetical protein
LSKTTSYEKIRKDNFISFRRDILSNLLQKTSNIDNLSGCLKDFNISLNLKKDLILIHARIDNYADFSRKYNRNDRKLMLFSIGNITSEILQQAFINETVESDSDYLSIIVNIDSQNLERLEFFSMISF